MKHIILLATLGNLFSGAYRCKDRHAAEEMVLSTEPSSSQMTAQLQLEEKDAQYKHVPTFQIGPHDQVLQTSRLWTAKDRYL